MHQQLNRVRLNFIIVLLISSTLRIFADTNDSVPDAKKYPTIISYLFEGNFIYGKPHLNYLDTALSIVDNFNPALARHHNYLGTNGSAAMPQLFNISFAPYTFNGNRSFDLQMFDPDSIRSYKTNKRYTELNYHSSAFKELAISFLHSQNITHNWNAGFEFDRQGVGDYMNYSDTYRSRFALFTWYHTINNKYNLFAHAIWNTIKNDVNGGLENDSLFDYTIVTNLGIKGLAYRLSNASQHQRKKHFKLSQYYDFGHVETDSTGKILSKGLAMRIHHEISFERKSYAYIDSDADSSFYSNFYYGAATYDSLHSDEIKNRIAIQLPADTLYQSAFFRNWSSGVFAEWQHTNYGMRTDTSWDNFSLGANTFLIPDSDGIEIFGEGMYVISGMDEGNYQVNGKVYSPKFSFGQIGVTLNTGQTSPDYIFRFYDGNNFRWTTQYTPYTFIDAGFKYELERYNLSIQVNQKSIQDYVYLNEDAMPDKYKDWIKINQVTLVKNFRYRNWHFDNLIIYQVTDKSDIIHLPLFVTNQSLYFERYYYRNALKASVGIKANYNSAYFADEFMPANAMFYLQEQKKTGGYIRFDLFINAKIKTANIFVRVENIADDLTAKSYYLTPHYPMPGRVFQFGVKWRFFD